MNKYQSKIKVIISVDDVSFLFGLFKLNKLPFVYSTVDSVPLKPLLICNCTQQNIVEMFELETLPCLISELNNLYQSIYTIQQASGEVNAPAFKKDLQRINSKNNSIVIAIKVPSQEAKIWANTVLKWAEKQAVSVFIIFLCKGEESEINKAILASQVLCHSYSMLASSGELTVDMRVKHSFDKEAFIFEKYYQLQYLQEGLAIEEKGALTVSNKIENEAISKALEAPLFLLFNPLKAEESLANINGIVMNSEQALFVALTNSQNAQVLIACHHNEELSRIATLVFTLRKRFGASVKIMVREMSPCLRYLDLNVLLVSGANSVINVAHSWSHTLDQIYALKFQHYAVALPDSIDQMLTKYSLNDLLKGETSTEQFVEFVSKQSQRLSDLNIHFSLVRLKIVENLSAKECLLYCKLKRSGDIITAHNGYLYLYLSAVRPTNIYIALDYIFNIHISEFFEETLFFDNLNDVQSIIKKIESSQVEVTRHKSLLNTNLAKDLSIEQYARAVPFAIKEKK